MNAAEMKLVVEELKRINCCIAEGIIYSNSFLFQVGRMSLQAAEIVAMQGFEVITPKLIAVPTTATANGETPWSVNLVSAGCVRGLFDKQPTTVQFDGYMRCLAMSGCAALASAEHAMLFHMLGYKSGPDFTVSI
jgi:hypothetical protein